MNRSTSTTILACLCLLVLVGCASRHPETAQITFGDNNPAIQPWTNLEVNNGSDTFQFAIVGDRTGGCRPGVFAEAVKTLNHLQPEFVMSVGDLIEGYVEDEAELARQWEEFNAIVSRLEMPFLYVSGNHDITNPVGAKVWRERYGRPYYHFRYHDVLFLTLCTEDGGRGHIGPEQVEYVRQVLADQTDVRWTLVFMHQPLWEYDDLSGFAEIETLLADRPYSVFAGHYHGYAKWVRNGRKYIRLATCGGGSDLSGVYYGYEDMVAWVTMTDEGPKVANIALSGVHDENVSTGPSARFQWDMPRQGVSMKAIFCQGETFSGAESQLMLTNVAESEVHLTGSFVGPEGVTVTPSMIDVTLKPLGKTAVDLKVSTTAAMAPDDAGPIMLGWQAVANLPLRPHFTIKGSNSIAIEALRTCAKAPGAVTIDGRLDEWAELPIRLEAANPEYADIWSGPDDGSARFAVAYDQENLYIACRAFDDEQVGMTNMPHWKQDGMEIWLDRRSRSQRSATASPGSDQRLVIGIGPEAAIDTGIPEGVRAVAELTDGGYIVEAAVPLTLLNTEPGQSWDGFRLNVVMFDRDTNGTAQLWWRPSWRTAGDYVGSGSFVRE